MVVKAFLSKPPLVSLTLAIVCIAFYYATDDEFSVRNSYAPSPRGASAWYTPVSAIFMHANPSHLWTNVVLLIVGGSLLELTESYEHALEVALGSGVLAFGFQGERALRPYGP